MRPWRHVPPFICSSTAAAAVAKSPVLRLSFWYDQPVPAAGIGMRICVRISSGCSLRRVQAEEEAVGLDDPLAARPVQHERRVERQHQRRMVVAGSPCEMSPPIVPR